MGTLFRGKECLALEEGTVRFWNDGRVREESGWLRLYLGDTSLLFCPPEGDAALLTADQRCANYLIYTGTPPRHVSAR